jgi:hypothetical protein
MADKIKELEGIATPAGGSRFSEIFFGEAPPGVAPPNQTPPEDISDISTSTYPTAKEKYTEAAIGAAQGVARSGPITAGGMMGLRIAAATAPYTGAYSPLVTIGATGAGMTAGYLLGQNFDEKFPGVSRQDLVPYREGGKTFGDTIAFAPFAFGIPWQQAERISTAIRLSEPGLKKMGVEGLGRASRFMTDLYAGMGRTAQLYPKSFLGAEASAAFGAGVAGGMAEEYAPGQPGVRLSSELAGGFFSPGRFLFGSLGMAKSAIGNVAAGFSKESREGRAANKLYSLLEDAGEDVNKVVRMLEANLPPGVTPTAGQKTGVPVLSVLENALARDSVRYGAETVAQGKQALRGYELLATNLRSIGTPEALRVAAQLREDFYTHMLQSRVNGANMRSAEAINKITRDTPSARADIGNIVRTNTFDALADARSHERALWGKAVSELSRPTVQTVTERVPVGKMVDESGKPLMRTREVKKVTLPSTSPENTVRNFLNETLDIADSVYKGTVPPLVKRIMGQMGVSDADVARYKLGRQTEEFVNTGVVPDRFLPKMKDVQLGELVNMRSNLLDLSREAAIKGNNSDARFFGNLAEGMLNDLGKIQSPALEDARTFSKTLNDFFTRSYAGEMMAKKGTGAQKLPAEVLVERAFGSNNDLAALRMNEIEDAVGMMKRQYDDAVQKFGRDSTQAQQLKPLADLAEGRVVSIRDANERILRLAAAQTIDPLTNRVSATRMSRFIAQNKPMLDKLGITGDLTDSVKAENLLKATMDANSAIQKGLRDQTAFAQVLKFENPSSAIADAMNSRFPVKTFSNMVQLAKAGGPDALNGLKASLYDYAFTKAGGNNNFSPQAFSKAFFEPIASNQPSVYNILRSQGVMTLTEGKNLKRIIDPMLRVERSLGNKQLMDGVVEGADAATELALRVVGSRLGTSVSGQGGASLIAASAGSKYMRQLFDKSPMLLVRGIMEEATKDPQMMAMLLRRGQSEGEKLAIARQMHAYLTAAGLNYARFEEPPPEPTVQAPPAQRSVTPRRQPATAPTRGVPGLNLGGSGPQQLGGSTPPGGGTSRDMLQRLFPFDTTIR